MEFHRGDVFKDSDKAALNKLRRTADRAGCHAGRGDSHTGESRKVPTVFAMSSSARIRNGLGWGSLFPPPPPIWGRRSMLRRLRWIFISSIDARAANEFSITATGRDSAICGNLRGTSDPQHVPRSAASSRAQSRALRFASRTTSPSAKAVDPLPPRAWRGLPSQCISGACAGLTHRLSARLLAANIIPTTRLPAGWAA